MSDKGSAAVQPIPFGESNHGKHTHNKESEAKALRQTQHRTRRWLLGKGGSSFSFRIEALHLIFFKTVEVQGAKEQYAASANEDDVVFCVAQRAMRKKPRVIHRDHAHSKGPVGPTTLKLEQLSIMYSVTQCTLT